jgi:hypothetical protein
MIMPEMPLRKWEWWSNGRARTRTICVTLKDNDLVIAHRQVGADGRMSNLNTLLLDVAHLPKLIRTLTRAFAVARSRQQIDQQ